MFQLISEFVIILLPSNISVSRVFFFFIWIFWFHEFFFQIKPEVPVGSDYVRQLVMYYCDLCHKYLPKLNRGDPDELVNNHCISPGHQNAFVKIEAEKRLEEHKALKQLERVCKTVMWLWAGLAEEILNWRYIKAISYLKNRFPARSYLFVDARNWAAFDFGNF